MIKKLLPVALVITMVFAISSTVFAENTMVTSNEYGLSMENVRFLEEHGVDLSIFENENILKEESMYRKNSNRAATGDTNEAITSLVTQTNAYNFTNEQIQHYVEGLIKTPTTVIGEQPTATRAVDRPSDDGIGYEVKSNNGYYQSTAFADLPNVHRSSDPTSTYMFWTVKDVIDVGLWYNYGSGGEGWRGFYTIDGSLHTGSKINSLSAGSSVYFNGVVENNGYLRFRVLDKNDFSNVLYDVYYYIADRGVTRSNCNWNRQITLCCNSRDFNNGSWAKNAEFSGANIYSSSGYSKTNASNTNNSHRGVFGTNSNNRYKVEVNNSANWHTENINIRFDK